MGRPSFSATPLARLNPIVARACFVSYGSQICISTTSFTVLHVSQIILFPSTYFNIRFVHIHSFTGQYKTSLVHQSLTGLTSGCLSLHRFRHRPSSRSSTQRVIRTFFNRIMAFVSTFSGAQLRCHHRLRNQNFCGIDTPRASSSKQSDDSSSFPPSHRQGNQNFEPFDGSTPLLPQWRPPSVEAEFNYSAKRIVSRERVIESPVKRLVKVTNRGYGTLFAEVIQEIEEGEGKVWLRPLLLDNDDEDNDTFVDLRGGSDLVLSKARVTEVDEKTKIRVTINMVATESDLIDRALSDERWNEISSKTLINFMRGLSDNQDE